METSPKQIIAFVLCLRAFPDIALSQTRDGIFGHTWGSPVAAVAEPLELHNPRQEANVLLYTAGMHNIGNASVDQCQVEFINGRLAGVIVTTRGEENSKRLLRLLEKEYGQGELHEPRAWTWMTAETHVAYDLDSFGDAYAYWYSLRLQK
jgi:hypothetical protein